jgi:hypothetical protein
VVVRRGRLAGSLRVPWSGDDATVTAALRARDLERHDAPPGRDDAEEMALILAWLDRSAVRLVAAEGGYAEPATGGAVLAATLAEARDVGRRVRRDRQALAGAKVTRRAPTAPDRTASG